MIDNDLWYRMHHFLIGGAVFIASAWQTLKYLVFHCRSTRSNHSRNVLGQAKVLTRLPLHIWMPRTVSPDLLRAALASLETQRLKIDSHICEVQAMLGVVSNRSRELRQADTTLQKKQPPKKRAIRTTPRN